MVSALQSLSGRFGSFFRRVDDVCDMSAHRQAGSTAAGRASGSTFVSERLQGYNQCVTSFDNSRDHVHY